MPVQFIVCNGLLADGSPCAQIAPVIHVVETTGADGQPELTYIYNCSNCGLRSRVVRPGQETE